MSNVERFAHDPKWLLENIAEEFQNEKLRAAVVILTDSDGHMLWRGAAYQKMELLWAIEKFRHEVLFEE